MPTTWCATTSLLWDVGSTAEDPPKESSINNPSNAVFARPAALGSLGCTMHRYPCWNEKTTHIFTAHSTQLATQWKGQKSRYDRYSARTPQRKRGPSLNHITTGPARGLYFLEAEGKINCDVSSWQGCQRISPRQSLSLQTPLGKINRCTKYISRSPWVYQSCFIPCLGRIPLRFLHGCNDLDTCQQCSRRQGIILLKLPAGCHSPMKSPDARYDKWAQLFTFRYNLSRAREEVQWEGTYLGEIVKK